MSASSAITACRNSRSTANRSTAGGGVGRKPGQLNNPWAFVLDSRGRIHVLDSMNHRVQRISRDVSNDYTSLTFCSFRLHELKLPWPSQLLFALAKPSRRQILVVTSADLRSLRGAECFHHHPTVVANFLQRVEGFLPSHAPALACCGRFRRCGRAPCWAACDRVGDALLSCWRNVSYIIGSSDDRQP